MERNSHPDDLEHVAQQMCEALYGIIYEGFGEPHITGDYVDFKQSERKIEAKVHVWDSHTFDPPLEFTIEIKPKQ